MPRLEPRDTAHLWDMLQAAELVRDFVAKLSYPQYLQDPKTQSAVERQLEIVGEAAKRISDAFKAAHAQIPWKIMVGQRNILAHEYGSIDPQLVWETATVHVPTLVEQLKPLIPPPPAV